MLVEAGGLIFDHSDLPGAAWTRMARHFGLDLGPDAIKRMRQVGQRHSKRPAEPCDPSRTGATAFRDLADRIVGPAMAALDTARARAEDGGAAMSAAQERRDP